MKRHFIVLSLGVGIGLWSASPVLGQTFPDGPGKAILQKECNRCHTPDVVQTFRHSADDWADVIITMNDQGATVTDEEMPVRLDYLVKNLGPRTSSSSSAAPAVAANMVADAPPQTASAEMPADYKQVLATLAKQGDFKDGVLKVNIPRSDLKVSVDGIARNSRRLLVLPEKRADLCTKSRSGVPISSWWKWVRRSTRGWV